VLIPRSGRVEQRVLTSDTPFEESLLADLRGRLLPVVMGKRLSEAAAQMASLVETFAPEHRGTVAAVVATLVETMSDERSDERVLIGGTANLTRFGDDFERSVKPMLEALEEQVVLLKLLGEATSSGTVTVRIGHEQPYEELASTSVVATGYGPGDDVLATLGIVGPTRMDYPGSMAAVRAVARYVSRILAES
jgi:heat-inducible transcriptional repressor